jgi:hypothetical protein
MIRVAAMLIAASAVLLSIGGTIGYLLPPP